MAKLYFRYAAMNAGKSLRLLAEVYNYRERGRDILLLSPFINNRDGVGKVSSRAGLDEAAVVVSKEMNILDYCIDHYIKNNKPLDCVFVDECHFLNKDHIWQLSDIADKLNIPVICYGLRTDFQANLFEGSQWLFSLADEIEEIPTICSCAKKARFNMRLADGKPVFEGEQVKIGGNESYISVCRKCYKKFRDGEAQ